MAIEIVPGFRFGYDQAIRFWSYVQKTDKCWIWTGHRYKDGYGQFKFNRKTNYAHRVSYLFCKGELGNLWVLHDCDTPLCVNPDHLFLGTQQDNVDDMIRKGRKITLSGEECPWSKLDEWAIVDIRQMLAMKITHDRIAQKYGVTRQAITKINQGLNWKNNGD